MIEGGLPCEKQRTGCQSISDTDGFSGRNETGGKRRTSRSEKEINGFIEKERDKGGIKVRTVDITKEGAELSGKSRDAMSRSRLKGFGNTTLRCRKK